MTTPTNMTAIDFGITDDRDTDHGICMWSWEGEWCAIPTVAENHSLGNNTPREYRWGARYGLHMPEGLPTHDSMWICEEHRGAFLKWNATGSYGSSVWQLDSKGKGTDVTNRTRTYEVGLQVSFEGLTEMQVSSKLKGYIMNGVRNDDTAMAWDSLEVSEVQVTT